ncbi:DUF5776 domain-containing protein [Lentilactobacillus raoultii]|uniref:DUF5776 domain-containing protein n=1 Tax=Lentilactobacillus raoultii TaxID=1987503 RepID=A0ABW3PC52_9LACO|nr:DUF5776 domain-containing protein [Lentilactobacillus raoultii]
MTKIKTMTKTIGQSVLTVIAVAMTVWLLIPGSIKADTTRTRPETFYVSSQHGSDQASGTSAQTPWQSIHRVNQGQFIAGDKILFERGSTWKDVTLQPKGSGNDHADITISDYGSQGELPKLAGEGKVSDVVRLTNQDHWTISHLDISNQTTGFDNNKESDENGAKLNDLRGIHITGQNVSELDGFNLTDLNVHDVSGRVEWASDVGLDGSTLKERQPGVYTNAGWDRSKRTGGILIESLKPTNNQPTIFKNVSLTNSTLERDSYGGFTIKQWSGGKNGPQWAFPAADAKAPNYESPQFKPHENITVKNNYIDQQGVYNCNGIYVTSSKHVMVEDNVVKNSGTCGIEINLVNQCVVQNNDVSGSKPKVGGADSNGIDADRRVSNTIFQYNYLHDNGDGFLICGFGYNGLIIRYNFLKDNTGIDFRDSVDGGFVSIDNNLIYNTLSRLKLNFSNASPRNETWQFENNVMYNVNSALQSVSYGSSNNKVQYSHNAYYGSGVSKNALDKSAITADPKFVSAKPEIPQTGDTVAGRVSDFSGFKLQSDSPLINAGTPYVKNSAQVSIDVNGKDYAGQAISGNPEVGLYEFAKTETPTNSTSSVSSSASSASVTSSNQSSVSSSSAPSQTSSASSATGSTTGTSSTSSSVTPEKPAKKIQRPTYKKGTTVYAIRGLWLYKTPTFTRANRVTHYPKKSRMNRPAFKIMGNSQSATGKLRYKVRVVNHSNQATNKIGYITTKKGFLEPAFYQHDYQTVTVLNSTGINAYLTKKLTHRVKHYRSGKVLRVKKIVRQGSTTRFELKNGQFITANRQLVLAGTHHIR